MNDAHLHLVVNHFPIIGPIFGLGILIVGMIFRNNSLKNTAYFLFIISAIFAALSMATGDGAEEIAEKLPEVTKHLIHAHEEMAEKLAIILYILGVISIEGIYLNFKKHSNSRIISFVALAIAVLSILVAIETGTSGGNVRHTEIRSDSAKAVGIEQNTIGKENDEDKN
jgi:uncharacterized membrane protein